MDYKKLKLKFHIYELWSLLGFSFIIYYILSFYHDSNSIKSSIAVLCVFIIGYLTTLFLNWKFFKPIKKIYDILNNEEKDGLLELKNNIFDLPLKRAIWLFWRFSIGGICVFLFTLFFENNSISQSISLLAVILVSGSTSALLLFFSIENLTNEIHFSLFDKIELQDNIVSKKNRLSLFRRIFFTLLIPFLFMLLFLGTLPFHLLNRIIYQQSTYSQVSNNLILHFAILTIFFLLLILYVAFLIGRNLIQRINSILKSFANSERGDLGTRTPILTMDELGNVAYHYNLMIRGLSEIFGKVRFVSDSVTQVAERLSASSVAMSDGVELQATSTYTTASSMAQMQSSITEVADSINVLFDETEKTSNSIIEMTSSIVTVAENIEGLSHSVDTTSTSIEEMNASIKQVAENSTMLNRSAQELFRAIDQIINTINEVEKWAIDSSKISNNVTIDAEQGHKAVQKTIEGMEKIHKFFQTSGKVIQNLGDRSQQIGNILTVIDDVSSQTNLLALNAAIISAQAGEHGKEFSVVANEIRELAEKATISTKEISHLIKSMQEGAASAVLTMEEGARQVAEGVILSHRAGDVLKMINTSSVKSAEMTNLIEEATIEQVKRSREIAKIVDHFKMMSDQIAVATKEQKIGISQIMREAENMRDMTSLVSISTEKQTNESRSISKAVSEVKEMVKRIRSATTQQKTESHSVLEAVEIFKDITLKNVDSMVEMDKAVDTLASQVRSLENQVARFRV